MPDKKRKIRGDDPNLTKRKLGKGERQIEVKDQLWTWKVGETNLVIRDPRDRSHVVQLYDRGRPIQDFATKNGGIEITPASVKAFISRYLV